MLSSCYVSCLLIDAGGEERADARLFDKIVMVIPVLFGVIIIYDYMCERSKKLIPPYPAAYPGADCYCHNNQTS